MCGRYRRKSGKQRIAEAFEETAGLDDLELAPDEDAAPGVTTTINWPKWPRYACNLQWSFYGCGSRASEQTLRQE
jgi:putative SOS response-associated peptidase YedK